MNINDYKIFIRDMNISDEELTNLIQQIIIEISHNTKIFRNTIGITISHCLEQYNIKDIYNLSSAVDEQISNITFIENTNYELSNEECNLQSPILTELTTDTADTTFLGLLSLLKVYSNIEDAYKHGSTTLNEDITYKYFIKINDVTFITKTDYLKTLYGDKYTFDILANCIYAPSPSKITTEEEIIIKPAIIAGLKYYLSDTYLNTTNEQVSNLLYQRYWSTQKQIRNNHPQLIDVVSEFKMDTWNK